MNEWIYAPQSQESTIAQSDTGTLADTLTVSVKCCQIVQIVLVRVVALGCDAAVPDFGLQVTNQRG